MINNAGFGVFGNFTETDLNKELEMIDTNIKAVHMLTKFFLKDMEKNNNYILNTLDNKFSTKNNTVKDIYDYFTNI